MRLVVLGGGGFRVPLVHGKILADRQHLAGSRQPAGRQEQVDELVLHDVDESRLAAVAAVLDQQALGAEWRPVLRTTTSLDEALPGADVVFSAIRSGGLEGRARDERIAQDEGLLGQETVGPGGVCYALRTIPIAVELARRVAELAPEAWLINFTNPAGVVTEAMSGVLGDRVIGICDSPTGLCRRVASALGVGGSQSHPARSHAAQSHAAQSYEAGSAWFDYVGLNHLGWLRRVLVGGEDRLPELLADDAALASFEEGRLFDPEWLRAIGAVPNEYLHHYYYPREIVAAGGERTRGEFLLDEQRDFYRRAGEAPDDALRIWREVRQRREESYLADAREVAGAGQRSEQDVQGGGYEDVALRLMAAIAGDRADDAGETIVLNVRNRGAVPALDDDAVVEVPCLVDGDGAHPVATGPLEGHFAGLMSAVKAVERDTIAASHQRSRALALRAVAGHPLVDSVAAATRALDNYAATFPELADFRR